MVGMSEARRLRVHPDPILLRECERLHADDKRIYGLIADMVRIGLKGNENGQALGLSAPQVGEAVRLISVRGHSAVKPDVGHWFFYANPKILRYKGGKTTSKEGCLSLPGVEVMVKRPRRIRFEAGPVWIVSDGLESGEYAKKEIAWAAGLESRIIQHELDHLHGILITDRGEPL